MNYRGMKTEELEKKLRSMRRLQKWCEQDGAEETAKHYALVCVEIEDILEGRSGDQVDLFGVPMKAWEEELANRPMKEKEISTAAKLRNERKRKKLTQKQLGMLVGIDENTVSSYETGRISPTVERMRELAGALGCELAAIL